LFLYPFYYVYSFTQLFLFSIRPTFPFNWHYIGNIFRLILVIFRASTITKSENIQLQPMWSISEAFLLHSTWQMLLFVHVQIKNVNSTLEQAIEAQKGSKGIALLFL
jgi:hypothetical protein